MKRALIVALIVTKIYGSDAAPAQIGADGVVTTQNFVICKPSNTACWQLKSAHERMLAMQAYCTQNFRASLDAKIDPKSALTAYTACLNVSSIEYDHAAALAKINK